MCIEGTYIPTVYASTPSSAAAGVPTARAGVVVVPSPAIPKPSTPVSNVNDNNVQGSTRMSGLDMLGNFFDFISGLCNLPYQGIFNDPLIAAACKRIPQFGLVWNKAGNATTTTYPGCNVQGCQCNLFPLDAEKRFFWFGVWIPPSQPTNVWTWSGGGVCLVLQVNSAGNGIKAGTGAIKLETKLFDFFGNFLCLPAVPPATCAKKKSLEAAVSILTGVGVGFSVDRSLKVDITKMPPLLVNARRRVSDVDEVTPTWTNVGGFPRLQPINLAAAVDAASTLRYTSDKEYFWACKYHAGWAFPTAVTADPYCSKLTAHVWMELLISPTEVLKRLQTKTGASLSPEANKPFQIGDLHFSFAMDATFVFSADKPETLVADVVKCLSPILTFSLFLLLLMIDFSFMLFGSVTMTLGLSKFSAGLFADWVIKLAALMVYFRKGGGGSAFYVTYSRGEAANDMGTIAGPAPNNPMAKEKATELYKNMARDNVIDALSGGEQPPPQGGVFPTGIQIQVYAIFTGCSGTFPNIQCSMDLNNIGFGFKVAICTGADTGFAVFLEKPTKNPQTDESDTLVFCFSDLKEEEKICINLGFLVWLLDVLDGFANMILAVAEGIIKTMEKLGNFVQKLVKSVVNVVASCWQPHVKWFRRRHYCNDYPRRRNCPMDQWCWGIGTWSTCGKNTHGATPFPQCRLWGMNPLCFNEPDRRRRESGGFSLFR